MKSYSDLLEEIELLKKENAALKAELAKVKQFVYKTGKENRQEADEQNNESSLFQNTADEKVEEKLDALECHSRVNRLSSPEEKIALFRSLFKGREDVFARRWQSKTTDRKGYQPVCGNEWATLLCDKKKYKCDVCPNRKLLHLTDKDIFNHLAGKKTDCSDVIGLFPMLTDETCYFCCLDFDDGDYQTAALAFKNTCIENDIPAYIERSRSGSGAHVWMFFESPVPTRTARQFAGSLLTCAMDKCDKIDFKCYDRMFPNQDNLPRGGFGNLIALPLQGKARKLKNSVFVDDSFEPYADQWDFLSRCEKVDEQHIQNVFSRLGKNETGNLVETNENPWVRRKPQTITGFDFPSDFTIVRANRLYIPKAGLSANVKNQLKRLAAFRNPDFYRTQAMRMPVYNKPRIISCAEEDDNYLILPRGCEEALADLLDSCGAVYTIKDKTNPGIPISVEFNGELCEEQTPAAQALLADRTGVLSATTAFGKTVIAAYLISQRKTNTLILVHTQALMVQWKKALEQFLIFDFEPPEQTKGRGRKKIWSPVGVLGAGKHDLHGNVDIAVMQSLTDEKTNYVLSDYGMVIVDECHHVSAVNFEAVLKLVNARFVYGLTATPTRADGHHPIIYMQCGPIRYRVDAKTQAEKRPFEHYMIPRFTAFRKHYPEGTALAQIYEDLVHSDLRNQRIAADVLLSLTEGKTPLVLTERKEHVELLADLIWPKCQNIITLTGSASLKEKREVLQELESIPPEDSLVVIATGKYVGEGFDYPRFDTLFLALPISWKGKLSQYAGRLHRTYPGKSEVLIYDYADIHIPMLEKMYQRRLKGYASIGYHTKLNPGTDAKSIIYDGSNFLKVYNLDISDASHSVLIVGPFMRMNRLKSLNKLFSDAIERGIKVTVITSLPDDSAGEEVDKSNESAEYLQKMGVIVNFKKDCYQRFTIIDDKIVWYGSINYLSFDKTDESALRFESVDLANALQDSIMQ